MLFGIFLLSLRLFEKTFWCSLQHRFLHAWAILLETAERNPYFKIIFKFTYSWVPEEITRSLPQGIFMLHR